MFLSFMVDSSAITKRIPEGIRPEGNGLGGTSTHEIPGRAKDIPCNIHDNYVNYVYIRYHIYISYISYIYISYIYIIYIYIIYIIYNNIYIVVIVARL